MKYLSLLTLLIACGETKDTEIQEEVLDTGDAIFDADGDGYTSDEDCDDNSAAVNPGAEELCDGLDNDCDDEIDEGVKSTFYLDVDQDGYGDSEVSMESCEIRDGYVAVGNDCDDADASVYPAANELCDQLDNNCDGQIDEGVGFDFYVDADGDGFGDENAVETHCEQVDGVTMIGGDCDDNNDTVNPDAEEICDGVDNDCNESTDEGVTIIYFLDSDGDGFGDEFSSVETCDRPQGYVDNIGDCNDIDATVNPLIPETCDGVDNNCDGNVDEAGAVGSSGWYLDDDGDGFGDVNNFMVSCDQPANYVGNSGDCNDADGTISPSMTEICDGLDNDCDGAIDDDDGSVVTNNIWYLDHDGDGFGDALFTLSTCDQPINYVVDSSDCDDLDAGISPSGIEICDGLDNDCDGDFDDADASVAYASTDIYFEDGDGDGFGDSSLSTNTCSPTSTMVSNDADCDDSDASISPNAIEVCDGFDNNCDNSTDGSDAINQTTWYQDLDADGHGNDAVSLEQCDQPTDFIDNNTDCDDADITVNPDEVDTCDGIDNDCDGVIDEDESTGSTAFCAATSCAEILADDPTAQDGIYYIQDANGNAIEAYCEMDLEGGGWLAVYNFIIPGTSWSDAGTMHASLIQNQDMNTAIEPDTMSTAIDTLNLPLGDYQEALYGWAPDTTQDVTHFGMYSDSSGLAGDCYLDGYCGANVAVGDFYISSSGNIRTIYTGNSPTYPHVGLGYSGQIIVWGYDRNNSSLGNWANWYDGNPCCNAGNQSPGGSSGRYVIYIR